MSNLPKVLKRIDAGWTIRFRQDYYGVQQVEMSWGWLRWPSTRVKLASDEIATVRAALAKRWEARRGSRGEREHRAA